MDDWSNDEMIRQVTLRLIATYGLLIKALQGIPLTIEIPAAMSNHYSADVRNSVTRAYRLLADIPMDPHYREQVRALLLDWVTAADYLFSAEEDYALWKVDFAVTQLVRVTRRAEAINNLPPEQTQ